MKFKVVFAIVGSVLLEMDNAVAQSYSEEALMISRIRPGGSARIQAMGGVQNSLGGDISSAYYNPAGLGMYNRSEFSFTPGYVIANSDASYLNNTTSASKTNLIIPNLGIAFHSNKDGRKGLWGGTFAINFNRTNDFNNTFTYKGRNTDNSIIDYFIQDANGTGTSQFDQTGYNYNTPTGLSYFNYLIGPQSILDPPGPNDQYFTDVSGIPDQMETVKTTGSQNQWSFSYGANFNDKIFVGGGIGLTSFHYKAEKVYTESFADPSQPMSFMQLNETLNLSGSGINATLGAIYRPFDQFQFGVSAATPTSYNINDDYSASMSTTWKNFEYLPGEVLNNQNASTDQVTDSYSLSTPWRVSGGITFFFEKKGFISADAEWLNYGSSKYSSNSYNGGDYSADNDQIKSLYKSVVNLRVGGEYRLNSFRFRGGFSLLPDPFKNPQNNIDRSITSYSAGFGYRTSGFYIDFAGIFSLENNSYRPYSINSALSPLVTLKNNASTFMITVGFPF
ncbi:MAG TPA: outer membrane protein transport protein [Cyclobacteriaceae bacterium]|nr:outer membrane protein transport protein [Cyclobacteriaceae bacterium]